MPSQREGGTLTDTVGPLHVGTGMEASLPIGQLTPETPENLFNLDLDRNGRATARPGSVFYSRIGTGPIVGLWEHSFESGARPRRRVAVVRNGFGSVNTHTDPDDDGVATYGHAFCPDVEKHGQVLVPFPAADGDRFQIESFLNRLWLAGSTADYALRFYDYSSKVFGVVSGVQARAVLAQGNRLFVGGDPTQPNVVFPSDPDDPDTFNPAIGIQVGNRNNSIVALREHEDMIVVLTDRSAHWLLAGAVELGDVQTDDISRIYGVVGPLAATQGSDGWLYWLSKQGPVRWRRGLGSVDLEFNSSAMELFENAAAGDLSSAVVHDDPVRRCIRFMIPTGDSSTPNYLLSYFHQHGGWTHGARTTSTTVAAALREGTHPSGVAVGSSLYTAMAYMRDPLDDRPTTLAGDESGTLWRWKEWSREKIRAHEAGHLGTDFRTQIRFGPLEIAPVGYRGQIHQLLLDFLGGHQFAFDVYAEMDFGGLFHLAEACSRDLAGGDLGDILLGDDDDARVMNLRLAPHHVRVPLWVHGLGKVIRVQVEWDVAQSAMAFTGVEIERSLASEAFAKVRGSPQFEEATLVFKGTVDPSAGEVAAGSSADPHDPPDPEDAPPMNLLISQKEQVNLERIVVWDISDPNNLAKHYEADPGTVRPLALCLDSAEDYFFAEHITQRIACWDVTDPTSPVLNWSYDIQDDTPPAAADDVDIRTMFYDQVNDVLLVTVQEIDSSVIQGVYLYSYDVSDRINGPVFKFRDLLGLFPFQSGWMMRLLRDGRTGFCGGNHDFGAGNRNSFVSFQIDLDGLGVNVLDTISVSTGHEGSARVNMDISPEETHAIVAFEESNNTHIRVIDISDPSNLSVIDSIDQSATVAPGEARGCAWGRAAKSDRVYVWFSGDEAAGDTTQPTVRVYDASDRSNISEIGNWRPLVDANPGPYEPLFIAPDGVAGYMTLEGALYVLDLSDEVGFTFLDSLGGTARGRFIATRYGPATQHAGVTGGPVTPLPANLAVCYARNGVLAFIDLTDESNPALTGFVTGNWTYGSCVFANDGETVVAVGSGTLACYGDDGAGLTKLSELVDSRLDGIDHLEADGGIVRGPNASEEIVEIDVSDPSNPSISAEKPIDLPLVTYFDAEQRGELVSHVFGVGFGVWLAVKSSGKYLSSTTPPELIDVVDVLIDGTDGYALSAYDGATLAVLDIESPYRQRVKGSLHLPGLGSPQRIVKDGSTVYVLNQASSGTGIAAVDVTDPTNPTLLDELAVGVALVRALDFAVSGTELWVVCGSGGDRVARVDISSPAALSVVTSAALEENFACDAGASHLIAAESFNGKVRAYSMGAPPAQVDEIEVDPGEQMGPCLGVAVFSSGGEKAAVVFGGNSPGGSNPRLFVIDTSDPGGAGLSVVGSTSGSSGDPDAISGANNLAFGMDVSNLVAVVGGQSLLAQPEPITIIDLSAPSSPSVEYGSISDDWVRAPRAFALDAGLLLIGQGHPVYGTGLADLGTLSSPSPHFIIDERYAGWNKRPLLARSSDRLFALGHEPAEKIVEISTSDPVRQIAGTLTGGSPRAGAFAVDWNAGVAVVARTDTSTSDTTIEVWDISDPDAASLSGSLTIPGVPIASIRPSGDDQKFILMGGNPPNIVILPRSYVAVLDCSTPSSPSLTGEMIDFSVSSVPWTDLRLW